MTQDAASAPNPWPDFYQARLLYEEASRLGSNFAPAGPEAPAALRSLLDRGWTPHLHEFIGSRMPRPTHLASVSLFASHPTQTGLFASILDEFPETLQNWPLAAPRAHDAKPANFEDAWSPWSKLGARQRSLLLAAHPELLGAPKPGDDNLWLKCAMSALMPPCAPSDGLTPVESIPERPFHSYFESPHWEGLRSSSPDLAWSLAACLAAMSTLHAPRGAFAPWTELASSIAGAIAPPISCRDFPTRLIGAALGEALAADRAGDFAALVRAGRIDSRANEEEFFQERVAKGEGELSKLLAETESWNRQQSRWGRLWPRALTAAAALDMRELQARGVSSGALAKSTLHTLCAKSGASRCWDALQAISPAPTEMRALAMHRMRLPSPADIGRRLERHMAAAASGEPRSAEALKTNLDRESARARRVLASLPIPASLNAALHGPGAEPPPPGPDALALAEGFDAEAKALFARECAKAEAKTHQGKPSVLGVPARFDWVTMTLVEDAAPSFFLGKLPPGALARSCAAFEIHDLAGIHARFTAADCAAIEADEIALASAPKASEGSEPEFAKRPRL